MTTRTKMTKRMTVRKKSQQLSENRTNSSVSQDGAVWLLEITNHL
jgi:hypothetical protein